jgi:hypothetical protein
MTTQTTATRTTTARAKGKRPTKAELQQQLAEATARAAAAEAALRATPPAGEMSLQPDKEGVLRIWIIDREDGYKLQLVGLGADGPTWRLTKWSDGTAYQLTPVEGGPGEELYDCNCPGCRDHGPRCNGGKGCRHARMLRALRQVAHPGR